MSDTTLEQRLAELRTLRDEIRVKLHLAEMDAKTAWKDLEPKIAAFERDAADLKDAAASAVDELRARAGDLKTRLSGLLSELGGASTDGWMEK